MEGRRVCADSDIEFDGFLAIKHKSGETQI